ncbi:MAG TPA: molybdopterin-dependent oxidoreductase [Acidimicrobiales bacterium]|nr:molybdopterin-dependent oxidoreductase [Acidimicrobiales bacterium]
MNSHAEATERVRPPVTLPRFGERLHDERSAALVGMALGAMFSICLATGVLSHLIQHPPGWFTWPARPAGFYRVSQGVHVTTGIALIPVVLAKLWIVYPKLFRWPPIDDVADAVERLTLLPLVGGMIFLLFSGTANVALWYPWEFSFPVAHYWATWITVGAMVAHVSAKATIIGRTVRRRQATPEATPTTTTTADRRSFLGAVAAASGTLAVATVGQTFRPLAAISVLGPRDPRVNVQGVPVNKAVGESSGLAEAVASPSYRLVVRGRVDQELSFSREDLLAMPQHTARLPIACVEGWSAEADWTGVRVRDLLAMAGARAGAEVGVESLQQRGSFRASVLNSKHAADRDTLLALKINGEDLHPDHGFPVRLIGPNRPGVQQTKWVAELVVR